MKIQVRTVKMDDADSYLFLFSNSVLIFYSRFSFTVQVKYGTPAFYLTWLLWCKADCFCWDSIGLIVPCTNRIPDRWFAIAIHLVGFGNPTLVVGSFLDTGLQLLYHLYAIIMAVCC